MSLKKREFNREKELEIHLFQQQLKRRSDPRFFYHELITTEAPEVFKRIAKLFSALPEQLILDKISKLTNRTTYDNPWMCFVEELSVPTLKSESYQRIVKTLDEGLSMISSTEIPELFVDLVSREGREKIRKEYVYYCSEKKVIVNPWKMLGRYAVKELVDYHKNRKGRRLFTMKTAEITEIVETKIEYGSFVAMPVLIDFDYIYYTAYESKHVGFESQPDHSERTLKNNQPWKYDYDTPVFLAVNAILNKKAIFVKVVTKNGVPTLSIVQEKQQVVEKPFDENDKRRRMDEEFKQFRSKNGIEMRLTNDDESGFRSEILYDANEAEIKSGQCSFSVFDDAEEGKREKSKRRKKRRRKRAQSSLQQGYEVEVAKPSGIG